MMTAYQIGLGLWILAAILLLIRAIQLAWPRDSRHRQ
jgi:hypothetical protein